MGIMSQLPSSHLSIHRVLTKLSNGIASHGVDYCQLQLLFLWIITGLFPCMVLISFSGRFTIRAPAGPGADEALQQAPSWSGLCSQSPARPPAPTEAWQDSGISIAFCAADCITRQLEPPVPLSSLYHSASWPGRISSHPLRW